jgi:predicted Zn-dependent peptidase
LTWFDLDVVPAETVRVQSPVPNGGEFRIFLETAPESVAVAAAAVLEELGRLRRGEVADAEIATARASLLARLPLLFDRAEVIAGRYAEDELLGRPHEYWSLYRQRLGTVTVTDLRRVAQRFIDMDGIALLVVGDSAAVQAGRAAGELRRLLGPPTVVPD